MTVTDTDSESDVPTEWDPDSLVVADTDTESSDPKPPRTGVIVTVAAVVTLSVVLEE